MQVNDFKAIKNMSCLEKKFSLYKVRVQKIQRYGNA